MGERRSGRVLVGVLFALASARWGAVAEAARPSCVALRQSPADAWERLADVRAPAAERLAALDELLAAGTDPSRFAFLLRDRERGLVARLLQCADPVRFPAAVERAVELLIAGSDESLLQQALALVGRRDAPGDARRILAAGVQHGGSMARHARLMLAGQPVAVRAELLRDALQPTASRATLAFSADLAARLAAETPVGIPELEAAARALAETDDLERAGFASGAWLALTPTAPGPRAHLLALHRAKRDERRHAAMEACSVALPASAREFAADLVEAALADPEWPVRRAALAAAEALALPRLAAPLVARLEQEAERSALRREAARALRRITGAPLRDAPGDWRRWLADHPSIEPPTAGAAAELEARLARQERSGTGGDFFAVPVRSDRIALVIDCSGSMGTRGGSTGFTWGEIERGATGEPEGSKLDRACAAARRLLAELPATARANLFFFDAKVRRFAERAPELDAATRARIDRFLDAQTSGGGTNLHGALVAALDDPEIDTIFLISDGAPSSGTIRDPVRLRRDIARRNRLKGVVIHAIAFDGGDRELLAGLAADSGGTLR